MNEASIPLRAAADSAPRALAPPRVLQLPKWAIGERRVVLACLCLLGLGLRLWDIGRRSFWLDELSSVGAAALSFPDFLLALAVEANMTLYYWVLFVWLRLVGVGADEGLIRLPSALIGAAAIPLVYVLGRQLHSTRAGLAASALLAVNSFHVAVSQEARSYAALATLTILSYLLLDCALQRGRWSDWALHGLVTALAFYSHSYTVFTILGQALFVLSRRSRVALPGLCLSGLVMGALLAQLLPFFIRQSSGAKLSRLLPPDLTLLTNFLVGFSGGSWGTLALYFSLSALGIAFVGAGARPRSYRNALLLTWLLVPVVSAFGISLIVPILRERYLFATLPALALLSGLGLARLPLPVGVAAFFAVAGLSLSGLQSGFSTFRGDDHWRQAVTYATSNALPGDGWAFISKRGQDGFEYYAGWLWGRNPGAPYGDVLEPFDWREALKSPSYHEKVSKDALERFAPSHPRIWLVQTHEINPATGKDSAKDVREWLRRHGYDAKRRHFRGVDLLLYERSGQS